MNKRRFIIWIFLSLFSQWIIAAKGVFPLVGTAQDLRVLAGEVPEFSFHLPQMAGVLKFGLVSGGKSCWINRPELVRLHKKGTGITYLVSDSLLGKGKLAFKTVGLDKSDGLILEITPKDIPDGVKLCWVFGGCYGQVLPDKTNVSLLPAYCKDNVFSVEGNSFTAYYGTSLQLKVIMGVMPQGSDIRLSNANCQKTPISLFASGKKTSDPILSALKEIHNGEKMYLCIYVQNVQADYNYFMLPDLFFKLFIP